MTEVIKRDGRREPFDADKLRRSIEAAARESKISRGRASEVVAKVAKVATEMAEKEREIETHAIRERVLRELDNIEATVSQAWRDFDRIKPSRR